MKSVKLYDNLYKNNKKKIIKKKNNKITKNKKNSEISKKYSKDFDFDDDNKYLSNIDSINLQTNPINYEHPLIQDYKRRINLLITDLGDLKSECINKEKEKLKLKEKLDNQKQSCFKLQEQINEYEIKINELIYTNRSLQKELINIKSSYIKINKDTKSIIDNVKSTLKNTEDMYNKYKNKIQSTHHSANSILKSIYEYTLNIPQLMNVNQQIAHVMNILSSISDIDSNDFSSKYSPPIFNQSNNSFNDFNPKIYNYDHYYSPESPREFVFKESSPLPPKRHINNNIEKEFPTCLKDLDSQIYELNKSLKIVSHYLNS